MMGFVCCLALGPVLSFWGWAARPEVMGWEDPGKSVGHRFITGIGLLRIFRRIEMFGNPQETPSIC